MFKNGMISAIAGETCPSQFHVIAGETCPSQFHVIASEAWQSHKKRSILVFYARSSHCVCNDNILKRLPHSLRSIAMTLIRLRLQRFSRNDYTLKRLPHSLLSMAMTLIRLRSRYVAGNDTSRGCHALSGHMHIDLMCFCMTRSNKEIKFDQGD